MIIIAIDPGPTTSGVVLLEDLRVMQAGSEITTDDMLLMLETFGVEHVVIEWLTSYGTAVGASVLDTARVVGWYEHAARLRGLPVHLITRPEVASSLVGRRQATHAQIHEACRQTYRDAGLAAGGGTNPVKGTKARPGPLHAVRGHAWSALAVGLAWRSRQEAR